MLNECICSRQAIESFRKRIDVLRAVVYTVSTGSRKKKEEEETGRVNLLMTSHRKYFLSVDADTMLYRGI